MTWRSIALSTHSDTRRFSLAKTIAKVVLYIAVIAVAIITLFPIYWMLVSTFQPAKFTLHFPPPLIPRKSP